MTDERINELAYMAWRAFDDGDQTGAIKAIEEAIRAALVEAFTEQPSAEMQIAGFAASTEYAHDIESQIYKAMCDQKRKEWSDRGKT